MSIPPKTICGYIGIIGRPNVGKSTLLNAILGSKLSITSRKPQTTRHRILGIKTLEQTQYIYVDTPGLHVNPKHLINDYLIKAATYTLSDVDIIIFVIDARYFKDQDEYVLEQIIKTKRPFILALNKIDKLKDEANLMSILEKLNNRLVNLGLKDIPIVPIAAKNGRNILELEKIISQNLPENPHFFPDGQITDKSNRFIAAEFIREKLMRQTGEEVPHALAVEIEEFKQKKGILHISAIIWVEREGQKKIIIGNKGEDLKQAGILARLAIEKFFKQKVFLRLWIKIKKGWTDDERALTSLGYKEF